MSTEYFTVKLKEIDFVLFVISAGLAFYLAVNLFGDAERLTQRQIVPLTVMAVGFLSSLYTALRIVPGSTRLTLTDESIILRQFWTVKLIQLSSIASTRHLGKGESRGVFSRKALVIGLKTGSQLVIPDCFDVQKEELSRLIQERVNRLKCVPDIDNVVQKV